MVLRRGLTAGAAGVAVAGSVMTLALDGKPSESVMSESVYPNQKYHDKTMLRSRCDSQRIAQPVPTHGSDQRRKSEKRAAREGGYRQRGEAVQPRGVASDGVGQHLAGEGAIATPWPE